MNKTQKDNAAILFFAGGDQPKVAKKVYKAKEYIEPDWLKKYKHDRDNVLLGDMCVGDETKGIILERMK